MRKIIAITFALLLAKWRRGVYQCPCGRAIAKIGPTVVKLRTRIVMGRQQWQ